MKTLQFSDLPQLGINPLTGEACAFGMRVLCDLSQEGVELMQEYFGLHGATFPNNWNSMVGGKPAVACIMLTREQFPLIARFALFREGYRYVAGRNTVVGHCGFNDADLEHTPALSIYLNGTAHEMQLEHNPLMLWRNPRNPAAASGSRNTHQATGRTE